MLRRPRHIGSPLQAYVARLFQRDQAREKQAKENGLGGGGAELLPGLEVLERRMLLSASYGPMPDQEVVTSDSADRPAVNVVSAPDNTIEVSNIKWRGQQVDAAQYEWIIRYSVDSQLSDAALTALAKDLSPFAEIENLNAPGFGVLTAPFPNLKGWQLNRWANTQGQIAYLEPNFTGSAATAPNDPAYDEGLWGLRNQGDSNGQKSLEYNTGSQTFVEVTDTGDPNYNPDFTEGIDINVEDAWSSTTGSLSVVVPVVDSGIDYTHPDLYLNIWVNQDEIPAAIKNNLTDVNSDGLFTFLDINDASNSSAILVSDTNGNGYIDAGDLLADSDWANGVDDSGDGFIDDLHGWDFLNNDNDPMDDFFHGTHVAGTIGAIGNNSIGVAGVNWDVQLMPVKILSDANALSNPFYNNNPAGAFRYIDAVEAVNYVTMLKSNFGANIVAANHSWSGSVYSQALESAFITSGTQGIISVMSAGNESADIDLVPFYPGSFELDTVVAVANIDSEGNINPGSNYGNTSVDLGAPGTNILSTMPVISTSGMSNRPHPKTSSYDFATGTSMAAPHVTGAIALLAAHNSEASGKDIVAAILDNVTATDSLAGITVSGGRLNVKAAMDALALAVDGPHVKSISVGAHTLPTDTITIGFTQDVAAASVIAANFVLTTDGADNVFGTMDDGSITLSGLTQSLGGDEVELDLGSNLAVDNYRLMLVGTGATPIRNASSDALDDGADHIYYFEIFTSDFTESNDVKNSATATGLSGPGTATYTGYIGDGLGFGELVGNSADIDLFSLDVNAGGTIIADIDTPLNGSLDSVLRLFDADGDLIFENDDWDNFDSSIKQTGLDAGTYYLGVSGLVNSVYEIDEADKLRYGGSTGAYSLDITVEDAVTATTAITGTVWHNIDSDAVIDSNEGGLYGWTVFIDSVIDNGLLDAGEQSTVTDQNGDYWLLNTGVSAMGHKVRLQVPSGWESAPVGSGGQDVIVGTGQTVSNINFGSRLTDAAFEVDSLLDHRSQRLTQEGDMTLRLALDLAAEYASDRTIQFDDSSLSGDTIKLKKSLFFISSESLIIDSNVALEGEGVDGLIVDGGGYITDGVFRINPGAVVSIKDIGVTGGVAKPSLSGTASGYGGGVLNFGELTLQRVNIFENTSGGGGGIMNAGDLTLLDSLVANNEAGVNSLVGGGGGIYNTGNMDINNSTISGNTASGSGGGIFQGGVSTAAMTLTNVTVTDNLADSDVLNSDSGGGISVVDGSIVMHNTIVAKNHVLEGISEASDDVSGAFDTSSSYNLIGTVTGSTGLDDLDLGNQVGITGFLLDPGLADLADNGGPTMTHALVYGSNAIDAGSDSVASTAGLTEDQRGEERFAYGTAAGSGQVDVGAYEWQPTTIVVDENGAGTTANGTTSIREALLEAESAPALSVIEFGSGFTSQNILMGSVSELDINSDVKILGETASWGSVTFDGQQGSGGTTRIFDVASDVEVSISHVTIKNGTATNGGGIQNAGTLFLDSVTVQDNVAGAGIGGGIYSLEDAVLTISDSMLSGNEGLFGGAIGNYGELDVIRSNVILNEAYHGGGIANANTGSLSILNSAVALNEADGGGGGVQSAGSTVILNSTVSGNTADADGGGVWQNQGTLTVVNGTIAENRANANDSPGTGNEGGGIYKASGATATLYNTIVATNERGTSSPTDDDLGGTFSSSSLNNLINVFSSGGGITDSTNGNMVGGSYDPLLGSLTFNGGATLNHALGTGSDAIDLGNNAAASLFLGLWDWDQRGDPYDRIDNGTVDIGAYEVQV